MFNDIKGWMDKYKTGKRPTLWVVPNDTDAKSETGVVHELADDTPEYVAQASLKITLNNNTIIRWNCKFVDSPDIGTVMQNAYSDFSQWYNNPQPTQTAHHYVMRYDQGETMIRRADIVSYNIEWKYIDED